MNQIDNMSKKSKSKSKTTLAASDTKELKLFGSRSSQSKQETHTLRPNTASTTKPQQSNKTSSPSGTRPPDHSDTMRMEQSRESDDDLDGIGAIVRPTSLKKSKQSQSSQSNTERLQKMAYSICSRFTVNTNFRFKSLDYTEVLKVYRAEIKRPAFGESQTKVHQADNCFIQIFTSLFSLWEKDDRNRYYLVGLKSSFILMTLHNVQPKNKIPYTVIYSATHQFNCKKMFDDQDFVFEEIPTDNQSAQLLVFKGNSVPQIMNFIMNFFLEKSFQFEIIANYKFLGCLQTLPFMSFNSSYKEQMEVEQSIVISKKKSQSDKPVKYTCNVEGVYIVENLVRLIGEVQKQDKENSIEIHPQVTPLSSHLSEVFPENTSAFEGADKLL